MLQQGLPEDFVLGTVESHTVKEFNEAAFKEIGINLSWIGSGANEVGISGKLAKVKVIRNFCRSLDSDNHQADYNKAKKKLKWEPKIKFLDLVNIMVKKDIELQDS